MLSKISLVCFTASYLVALAIEVLKLWFRASWQRPVAAAFGVAGFFAQGVYLYHRMWPAVGEAALVANWYQWCLVAAWGLAAVYLVLKLVRPEMAAGIFVLPLVLALIAIAAIFHSVPPFATDRPQVWFGLFHGLSLLAGTVSVLIGFVAGVMYLIQSYRLRQKLPPLEGLDLPSLEWLQNVSSRSLIASTAFLALGLISGIIMNLTRDTPLPWTNSVIVSSGVLLVWLAASTAFELLYQPAQQGQKVAYLTLANFLFLCLALGFALWADHASPAGQPATNSSPPIGGPPAVAPARPPEAAP
jgi:hypothetical protein